MEINVSNEGDICVVALDGKFDIACSKVAETTLVELLDSGVSQMLIDFSKVPYIASSGLRVLLKVAQRLGKDGGKLHVCCLNEIVLEVFEVSGFDKIFSVFSDSDQARGAF